MFEVSYMVKIISKFQCARRTKEASWAIGDGKVERVEGWVIAIIILDEELGAERESNCRKMRS